MLRMQATARKLTSWSAKTVGNIRQKMAISRELILKFDKAQEDRALPPYEIWIHKTLKLSYLGYASLDRTIGRQRARIAVLKDGDANTTFHQQCSYRRWKNRILSLTADDRILTEATDIAEAAFLHFEVLLGTEGSRDCTLNLDHLIKPDEDLHDL
jgi:hypothetical protein